MYWHKTVRDVLALAPLYEGVALMQKNGLQRFAPECSREYLRLLRPAAAAETAEWVLSPSAIFATTYRHSFSLYSVLAAGMITRHRSHI
jgi:hypothetical protein